MEAHDKFPEERIGTVAMLRNRSDEVDAVAEACDAEADEQEAAVTRLRDRAALLRQQAEEYRVAAHAIERMHDVVAPSPMEAVVFGLGNISAENIGRQVRTALAPLLGEAGVNHGGI